MDFLTGRRVARGGILQHLPLGFSTPFCSHLPCRSVPFRLDPSFPSASAPLRSVLGLWFGLKGSDSDLGRRPVG